MKRNQYLFELIFAVATLAVVGAVVVQLFVKADIMRKQARDLDRAVLAAQTAVEEFKRDAVFTATVYYDKDFNAVAASTQDGFVMTTRVTDGGDALPRVQITIEKVTPYLYARDTEVFYLETVVFQ